MKLIKKKINIIEAIMIFVDSILEDCKKTWPNVVNCITKNDFEIADMDDGYGVWVMGVLALDTLHANQILDKKIADIIYRDVAHYLDFRIKDDWPSICKKMYDFFCYMYLKNEEEYMKNPDIQKAPPISTSITVLLGIILGFENISKTDSVPFNSPKTINMFKDFVNIVFNSIGRWKTITNEYKINWLL